MLNWLRLRDVRYIAARLASLVMRYGLTSRRAKRRLRSFVSMLTKHGCQPTFATPGRVVARHARFCQELEAMGAEFAVHGHEHVNFLALSEEEVTSQFLGATEAYRANGIAATGFRCPYLSFDDRLLDAVPVDMFVYSSNQAILWSDVPSLQGNRKSGAVFHQLLGFYRPSAVEDTLCVPSMRGRLVEIPVSIPGDLQLHDGLRLSPERIGAVWTEMLHEAHRRGELFAPLFHPETVKRCEAAYEILLRSANSLEEEVWIAQLAEIGEWWTRRREFAVATSSTAAGLELRLSLPKDATVLARGLDIDGVGPSWDDFGSIVESDVLEVPGDIRPFIGLTNDVPVTTQRFLENDGYVVERDDHGQRCGVRLDRPAVEALGSDRALAEYLQAAGGPLLRLWRWPKRTQSVVCLSGDLDALSLRDYGARIFGR